MKQPLLRTLRCRNDQHPGVLGRLATAIGAAGANLGDIRTVWTGPDHIIRDLNVWVEREDDLAPLIDIVSTVPGTELLEVIDAVHDLHLGGKLEVRASHPVRSQSDLRRVYTPGVAEVCRTIAADPGAAHRYTIRGKSVAIVTNGTRVLGLGDIGPLAALPVMEGKAALLHQFVGLSAFPISLDTKDPDAIVETVVRIAPSFGAIQLEDIASPVCFDVEERLMEALDIPVMHDDQHGTAVAALAAATNATRAAGLDLAAARVGVIGLGAAGSAIARMLGQVCDRAILGYDPSPDSMDRFDELGGESIAGPRELLAESDLVVAVTGRPGLIDAAWIRPGQAILALSNPDPEITPDDALRAGAAFAADGRSVNNLLGFPGILRAAIDCRALAINDAMYLAAAQTIAECAHPGELVPDPLRRDVHRKVARAVAEAAEKSGVARVAVPSDYAADAADFGVTS